MSQTEPSARITELTALPLFGQALVAARLARRAVLAMMEGEDKDMGLAACDAMERVAERGDGWAASLPEMRRVERIRRARGNEAALEAVRWAFDSVGAAQGANDIPVDAIVAASASRCFDAVRADRRVSALQVAILIAADIDQIGFACGEIRVNTYDGVTGYVLERLAPCHALTLTEPRPTAEELAR